MLLCKSPLVHSRNSQVTQTKILSRRTTWRVFQGPSSSVSDRQKKITGQHLELRFMEQRKVAPTPSFYTLNLPQYVLDVSFCWTVLWGDWNGWTIGKSILCEKPTHVDRESVDCRPTNGRHITNTSPTLHRLSAVSWPSIGRQSAVSRPSVGRQSAVSWLCVSC